MQELPLEHEPVPRVLVVEDEDLVADALMRWLRRQGYEVERAVDGQSALEQSVEGHFDLVLLDLNLPRVDGWGVLKRLGKREHGPTVVIVSATNDVQSVVRAMRLGALGYVAKPTTVERLGARLKQALETATVRRSLRASTRVASGPVIRSSVMKRTYGLAQRVALSPSTPILILGESGAGKEVLASFIHQQSTRSGRPFVRVNLAAIPASMVEAELFGSVRGAFTGAHGDRMGLVASADGGTLLLDELCEFDVNLQAKLLRLVEQRAFFPVGSDRERKVDVRLIAATNVDPQQAMREGRLRPDLYYRVSTVTLRLPPLRERREEILPLARRFLAEHAQAFGRPALEFSAEAEFSLRTYDWPGNVRQLRNAVERAALVGEHSCLSSEDLGLEMNVESPSSSGSWAVESSTSMSLEELRQQTVAAVESEHIRRVLELAEGSTTRAAEILGISRSTLWTKIRRYGLEVTH